MTRVLILVSLVLAYASPAFADPRFVRVIWDVGQQKVYFTVVSHTQQGHDGFDVPADALAARARGFTPASGPFLQKGDRVRVYVVNYNGVSHVWHDSSVVEQIAESPSLVGPLLNALALAVTGAAPLPKPIIAFARDTGDFPPPANCSLTTVREKVAALRESAQKLGDEAIGLSKEADRLKLLEEAGKIGRIATNKVLWEVFDNEQTWQMISSRVDVFGKNFQAHFATLGTKIDAIQPLLDKFNADHLALDREIALATPVPETCVNALKSLLAQRDNWVAFVRESAGDDSLSREAIARYQAADTVLKSLKRKLLTSGLTSSWAVDAVEMIVKEPVKAESVLRIDAVFASVDKTVQEKIQRIIVLGVEPYLPKLVVGTGLAAHGFTFRKLEVVKKTATAADGTVSAKNELRTAEDTTWQRLAPVWLQHVRVAQNRDWGYYLTFGTTPDRNIFRNGIVGVSAYKPRWRTVITVGVITARGYYEDDLTPVKKLFTDANGLSLVDSAGTLPLPETKWRKRLMVSVTFGLISF